MFYFFFYFDYLKICFMNNNDEKLAFLNIIFSNIIEIMIFNVYFNNKF